MKQQIDVVRFQPPFADILAVSLKVWLANMFLAALFFGVGAAVVFLMSMGGLVLALGGGG